MISLILNRSRDTPQQKPPEMALGDKYMNNDIVSQLLNGSHNIDKMKNEIQQVVSIILGLCDDWALHNLTVRGTFGLNTFKKTFDSENSRWEIERVLPEGIEKGWMTVHCSIWVSGQSGRIISPTYAFADKRHAYPGLLSNIRQVRNNLSVFVEGMIREVPSLRRRLEMITDEA